MRVLQFIPSLHKGGAERMFVDLANNLLKNGCTVDILLAYPSPPQLNQYRLNASIPISIVGTRHAFRLLRYGSIVAWTIRNRNKLKDFDIIHAHLNDGLIIGLAIKILFCFTPKKLRPGLVFTCHMVGMAVPKLSLFVNSLGIYIFDEFVLMAANDFWKKRVGSQASSSVSVISNGIDWNRSEGYPQTELEQGKKSNLLRIGTLTRLEPERNPVKFLNLFSLVKQNMGEDNFRFILGGDGSLNEFIHDYAKSHDLLEVIDFKGLVVDSSSFLRSLDIYISLNVCDQTGIAALEAIFQGVPVIGIQIDKNYVGKDTDLVWSSSDLIHVSDRIRQLYIDENLRNNVREKQFKTAREGFTAHAMASSYLKRYNRLH